MRGETRQLVLDPGLEAAVPPKTNGHEPWEYDRDLYKRRSEVERLFRRLKVFAAFEKHGIMLSAFMNFVPIGDMLKC